MSYYHNEYIYINVRVQYDCVIKRLQITSIEVVRLALRGSRADCSFLYQRCATLNIKLPKVTYAH